MNREKDAERELKMLQESKQLEESGGKKCFSVVTSGISESPLRCPKEHTVLLYIMHVDYRLYEDMSVFTVLTGL